MGREPVSSAVELARAARVYWVSAYPLISRELRHRRERAQAIPDPVIRAQALAALAERGNMEGAAAFAAFAPRAQRNAVVRATVAFQAAYNHLDVLSEQPCADRAANARALHEALLVALDPATPHGDYYAHSRHRDDGGYLREMVQACRTSFAGLPSHETVAPAALRAAERVLAYQVVQAEGQTGREDFDREPRASDGDRRGQPAGTDAERPGLRWWETLASEGSSLGVHVMIATAAEPAVARADAGALEHAYHPWIGALHSLLDHLIDADEDARIGQRNLIACYRDPEEAAVRMGLLTRRALAQARALRPARRHELIVAAMACFYLAEPRARTPRALPVARAVLAELGSLAGPALTVFRLRRLAGASSGAPRRLSGRLRGLRAMPGRHASRGSAGERRSLAA